MHDLLECLDTCIIDAACVDQSDIDERILVYMRVYLAANDLQTSFKQIMASSGVIDPGITNDVRLILQRAYDVMPRSGNTEGWYKVFIKRWMQEAGL